MSIILGESATLKVIEKDGNVLLKSHLLQNLFLFLLMLLLTMIPLSVLEVMPESKVLLKVSAYMLAAYVVLSVLVLLTYRKVYDFDLHANRLTMYRTIAGIRVKKVIDFDAIQSFLIRTVKRPMVGVSLPSLVDKYELNLLMKSGKMIFVDRSTDPSEMLIIAYPVSKQTSIPIVDK